MTRSYRKLVTVLAAAGVFAASAASAASAQSMCGERESIIEELQASWEEQRAAIALASNGGVLEVFTSNAGTWTLLMTMPGGPTCLIGAGDAWEPVAQLTAGEPA